MTDVLVWKAAAAALVGAHDQLGDGWIQGRLRANEGACLVAALQDAAPDRDAYRAARSVVAAELGRNDTDAGLWSWNDRGTRVHGEVLAVVTASALEAARRGGLDVVGLDDIRMFVEVPEPKPYDGFRRLVDELVKTFGTWWVEDLAALGVDVLGRPSAGDPRADHPAGRSLVIL